MRLVPFAAAALLVAVAGCGAGAPSEARPVTVAPPVAGDPPAVGSDHAHLPPRNAVDAPGAFAIVEEDSHRLILADEVKDEMLASPPFELTKPKDPIHVLEAKVKLADLSPEIRLEGRTFVLYRGAERKCVVRAGAIRAVGYTTDLVDGGDQPEEGVPQPTPEERGRELWASANHYLTASVSLGPECKGATWARLEELPEPRFATLRKPTDVVAGKAATAFRARPQFVETQKSFVDSSGSELAAKGGLWEDEVGPQVTEIVAPFAGGTYVLRQAASSEGCGWNASFAVVWRESDGGLAQIVETQSTFDPEVIMDLDGDGKLEMFGTLGDGTGLVPFWGTKAKGNGDDGRESFLSHAVAIHGCRC